MVEEVFPIADDADRDQILRVIDEMKGAATAGDMSATDRYGISIKLQKLAIVDGLL